MGGVATAEYLRVAWRAAGDEYAAAVGRGHTPVLAIRSAQVAATLIDSRSTSAPTRTGCTFSDYLAFCEDALRLGCRPAGSGRCRPRFSRIEVAGVILHAPGAEEPALRDVSVEIQARRGGGAHWGRAGRARRPPRQGARPGCSGVVGVRAAGIRSSLAPDVDGEPLRERIAVIAQDHANWPLTVRGGGGGGGGRSRLTRRCWCRRGLVGADTIISSLAPPGATTAAGP